MLVAAGLAGRPGGAVGGGGGRDLRRPLRVGRGRVHRPPRPSRAPRAHRHHRPRRVGGGHRRRGRRHHGRLGPGRLRADRHGAHRRAVVGLLRPGGRGRRGRPGGRRGRGPGPAGPDVYSYLHIPLVLGVVFAAVGIHEALVHPGEPLDPVFAAAFAGASSSTSAGWPPSGSAGAPAREPPAWWRWPWPPSWCRWAAEIDALARRRSSPPRSWGWPSPRNHAAGCLNRRRDPGYPRRGLHVEKAWTDDVLRAARLHPHPQRVGGLRRRLGRGGPHGPGHGPAPAVVRGPGGPRAAGGDGRGPGAARPDAAAAGGRAAGGRRRATRHRPALRAPGQAAAVLGLAGGPRPGSRSSRRPALRPGRGRRRRLDLLGDHGAGGRAGGRHRTAAAWS